VAAAAVVLDDSAAVDLDDNGERAGAPGAVALAAVEDPVSFVGSLCCRSYCEPWEWRLSS
jgi:hypothetical protein